MSRRHSESCLVDPTEQRIRRARHLPPSERGVWARPRPDEAEVTPAFVLDAQEINRAADLELQIETRFRRERIEGGAHLSLGECDGEPLLHPLRGA